MAAFLTVQRRKAAREHGIALVLTKDEQKKQTMLNLFEVEKDFLPYQSILRDSYDRTDVQVGVAHLIFANFIVEAAQAQVLPDSGSSDFDTFYGFELFFTIIFTIELLWNMYGHWFLDFFTGEIAGWNLFDLTIVLISLLSLFVSDFPGITVLRLFRAFRIFRVFKRIKSLRRIIEGVLGALPGVFQVFMVMIILMGIWSVIGVEFFADHAEAEFGSFSRAMFTMFQIMTMNWSGLCRQLMYDDDLPLASVFFITYIFAVGIVMTNVVVAILLDRYLAAMDQDDDAEAKVLPKNWPELYIKIDGILKPMRTLSWPHVRELETFLKGFNTADYDPDPTADVVAARPVSTWTIEEVSRWLNLTGFEDWTQKFEEDKIDGRALSLMTGSNLDELGMKFGTRKIFLRVLYRLFTDHPRELQKLDELKMSFDEYDTSGDGLIELEEFKEAWRRHFPENFMLADEDIADIFREMDTDNSGSLTFLDFRKCVAKGRSMRHDWLQSEALTSTKDFGTLTDTSMPGEGDVFSEVEMGGASLSAGYHGDHRHQCKAIPLV